MPPLRWDQRLYLAFLATLPVMQPLGASVMGAYVYVADFFFLASAGLWVIALARRQTRVRPARFPLVVAAYVALLVVAIAASSAARASAPRAIIDLYVVVIALASFEHGRTSGFARHAASAWIVGTVITASVALVGLALFYCGVRDPAVNLALGGYGSLPPGNYPRVTATFLNFNVTCNYLSVGLFVALATQRLGWLGARSARLVVVVVAIAMVFTVSPGLGGVALGIGIWTHVSLRETARAGLGRLVLGVGIAAASAFVVAAAISPNPAARTLEPSPRLQCWGAAWRTFEGHPLVGVGPGVPLPCPEYVAASGAVQHLTDAHNVYLSVAAHAGVGGLLGFLGVVAWPLAKSRPWSLTRARSEAILPTALAVALVQAILYQGLTGSFEHTRHLWAILGIFAGLVELPVDERRDGA